MASSILRWLSKFGRRSPSPLRNFPKVNFDVIDSAQKIEEETIPGYVAARYYPVNIGEVFASRYQVVGKLGFGTFSTVWLARDLNQHRHVTLKVFIHSKAIGSEADNELIMCEKLGQGSRLHPGRASVRTVLDAFKVSGPDGEHQCLIHEPLWESVRTFLARNPVGRLPEVILQGVLRRVLEALDYSHIECHIIHTDIKADNILFEIDDAAVFEAFERMELEDPCPRKIEGDRTIYTSRELQIPRRIGKPVLCDFGVAVSGQVAHDEDVQPDIYRAPEVMLKVPWDYKIDIWNVGAMIWDIFEDKHLFHGIDPEHETYRTRAHLAEVVALLGPPPLDFLQRGKLSSKFFDEQGNFQGGIDLPAPTSLEDSEENLGGENKKMFLQFVKSMLAWAPEDRKTAKELLKDPWLNKIYK